MSNEKPTDRLKRAQGALETICTYYWIALVINSILLFGYLFWALTASNYAYTAMLPAGHPGALTTQRWSADFVATGSTAAIFFLILSGAWVVAHPLGKNGMTAHLIMLLLALIYYIVVVSFIWSFQLAKSNVPASDNALNGANDWRWCCVNYNLPGVACPNAPNPSASPPLAGYGCGSGLSQADLIVDGTFLFKFCGLIIALVFMLIDGVYMLLVLRPTVRECNDALRAMLPPDESAPQQQQQQQQQDEAPQQQQQQQQQSQGRGISVRIGKPIVKPRDPHGILPRLSVPIGK